MACVTDPWKKVATSRFTAERGALPRDPRQINISGAFRPMPGMSLFLQNSQQRANGGIAGRVGQGRANLGRRGGFPGVKDIHDLAFPPAEMLFNAHASAEGFSIFSKRVNPKMLKS